MWPGTMPTFVPSGIFINPAIWPQNMDQKLGRAVPLFLGGRAGSPSNTMSPGPTPTFIPSGILINRTVWPQQTWAPSGISIHPTVWPQYTKVTDRQNRPIAQGEPFYQRSPKNLHKTHDSVCYSISFSKYFITKTTVVIKHTAQVCYAYYNILYTHPSALCTNSQLSLHINFNNYISTKICKYNQTSRYTSDFGLQQINTDNIIVSLHINYD